ncbi:MAG: tripartite tricarboxylate transporter permease [Planctomycetes bacterium]|nr:tripartite tricarboxylate transporter permease [Planctomycetota bacterium]
MDNLVQLFVEFHHLLHVDILALLFLSTLLGVIIGALPGLTATMGVALLTGLTYRFPVVYTFAILMGVYVGGIYGGSISAILLNIPGTASAAATALEGYPLMRRGKAESVIRITRAASVLGTLIGVLALAVVSPPLTTVALMFTSPEYFMLAVFGVLMCGSVVTMDIPLKGWIGGVLGLLFAMVGIDTIHGAPRFTMGIGNLMGGISLVPAMIGFYALPEVIKAFARDEGALVVSEVRDTGKIAPEDSTWYLFKKHLRLIVQSSLLGIGIGALPGVGEDVAAWVAYDTAKKTSKTPEQFGKGSYEGVIAPEVANNSAIGGALIPMLTLAVPGSPVAAVLLGALVIHNIRPGPMIMQDNPAFISHISALLFLSVVSLYLAGLVIAKPMTKILKIPKAYLMPVVTVLSIVGSYAINNSAFDITVAIVFGIVGYCLDKMKYSPAPIVLGLILGNMIDQNFRRALMVSRGSYAIFFQRPISLLFFGIIVLVIVCSLRRKPHA